jgi:hypothetical protein
LVSKLQARVDLSGSPEYALAWNSSATPLGPSICRLRASRRRTSDSDFGGWPSPKASHGEAGGRAAESALARTERQGKAFPSDLRDAAALSGWPSPVAADGERASEQGRRGENNPTLLGAARMAGWPTPMAGSPGTEEYNEAGNNDSSRRTLALLSGWQTPTAEDASGRGYTYPNGDHDKPFLALPGQALTTGTPSDSSTAPTGRGVASRLNCRLSSWLMGYPLAWLACGLLAASETSRSRKQRRKDARKS